MVIKQSVAMETTQVEVTDSEAPLLLISDGSSYHKYVIYSLSKNRLSHLNIPELRGWRVLVTSYGWLVLTKPESKECCLFNPKSKDKIQLPRVQLQELYATCILTKLPTKPDCYVVFRGSVDLCFCRIGGEEFAKVPFRYSGTLMSFEDQIYGFYRGRGIVTIHFVGKTVEFRPVQIEMMHGEPKPWFRLLIYRTWLIESCGEGEGEAELLIVHKMYLTTVRNGINFRVCRVDPVRMSCEELVNIGNRTIFLSYSEGGYCCRGPSCGIKPNSIYYINIPWDTNFHVFDMENSSVTSLPLPSNSVSHGSSMSWVDKKTFFS